MSQRTCLLDANACGPGLAVDGSLLQVTTAQPGLDAARMVLGDLGVLAGDYAYECYVWTESRVPLAGRAVIGIAAAGTSPASAIGATAQSAGYRVGDGAIRTNNATVATVQASPERACIGVRVHAAAKGATVTWYVDGTELHTLALPAGAPRWLPALTICGGEAGDIRAVVNFGQHRWDAFGPDVRPWATRRAGLPTLYLSHALEGFLDQDNVAYAPCVLTPERFTVTTMPRPWWQSGGAATSYAALRLDNADGRFDALVAADARDGTLIVQRVPATIGAGNTADAVTQCTAIIDAVSQSGTVVDVRLKGTLARFDRPLPCRVIPPFADESSRGRIWPVALGSQRLVQPLLYDDPERIYILGDAPMSNVTMVADGGAPLDPYATPPQWQGALGGRGIKLETDAVMRLAVDCSSVGDQYEIPGAADVLAGAGSFLPWSAVPNTITTAAPAGWTFTNYAGSTLYRIGNTPAAVRLLSGRSWLPSASQFGDWLAIAGTPLLAGRSYRLTCRIAGVFSPAAPTGVLQARGGLMLRMETGSTVTDTREGAITPHGQPLTEAQPGTYSISFTVPAGADRRLFLVAVATRYFFGGTHTVPGGFEVSDLKVELLGQFVSLPLDGITLTGAFREILARAGEPASLFSAADTEAIDAATGYRIGLRWPEQPNIRAALQEACDQFGAVMFEDAMGTIRVRRVGVPGTPVARFEVAAEDLASVRIRAADASRLTTIYGARVNESPFGTGDFVTDTDTVPPALRESWQRDTQFLLSAAPTPAAEYTHAIGASRQVLRHDDRATAQAEGNRVVGLHAERGLEVEFPVDYDASGLPGGGLAPEQLMPGDTVTVHIPSRGIIERAAEVVGHVRAPFANRITVTVRCT